MFMVIVCVLFVCLCLLICRECGRRDVCGRAYVCWRGWMLLFVMFDIGLVIALDQHTLQARATHPQLFIFQRVSASGRTDRMWVHNAKFILSRHSTQEFGTDQYVN